MHRRHFLTSTCLAGLLPSCRRPTDPALRPPPGPSEQSPPGLDETGATILWYASLAPSTHNTQPWAVRILTAREWILEADHSRSLPVVDPDNRELLLSLGAFAENLALAAGSFGLQACFQVLTRDPGAREIMKVNLHPGGPTPAIPLSVLQQRMTMRNGLKKTPIRAEHVQSLRRVLAEAGQQHMHFFPNGTEHVACLARGAAEQFRLQSERDEAQEELIRWLRLNPEAETKHRDGLSLKAMGLTGIKAWFVSHFTRPEDFLKDSFRQKGMDAVREQVKQGGGWIVLTSSGGGVAECIQTGRQFQRLALQAHRLGIGLHPMSQYLEEHQGLEAIRKHHQAGLRPQFLLRCGYVDAFPEPVSLRRPLAWFIRSA